MLQWRLRDRTLSFQRALVMGIVNVTPDSFSDGGQFATSDSAIAHGLKLAEEGADILDIGGESTRPGATPVPAAEELVRVVPVVTALAKQTGLPLSIDTYKAEVARACLDAGAHIINDVTALTGDPLMINVARETGAGVVLMHMQGTPQTMQLDPKYEDVVNEIRRYLKDRLEATVAQGIVWENLTVDPGVGFGKTHQHNIEIVARLEEFQALGRPLCLGVSRKGFIGKITGKTLDQRLAGSLAVASFALAQSAAQILRVHDVAQTRDAVLMCAALRGIEPQMHADERR